MIKRLELLAAVPLLVAIAQNSYAAPQKKKPKKPPPAAQPAAQPPASQPTVQPLPGEPQEPVIEIEPGTPAAGTQPGRVETAPQAAETPTAADQTVKAGGREESWQDVVVVVRKPFLKQGRFEFVPMWQVTLNDNMIRHHAPTAQINYWLTDVLAVGVEGQLYEHFGFLEPHDLVSEDYRRLPTLNEYVFGAALDFHYVPIYAKFAMFNKYMVHWEGMFTAGVGVTQTRILPRDPANPGWDQINITPNVGFQIRVFLTRWLMLDLGVKDYIFVDKFENVSRTSPDVEDAKANATSQLINNIMFGAGISFWLPTSFQYTTFR